MPLERTPKTSWEEFGYSYIETAWFDDDREKTLNAMRHLWEAMPEEDLDRIPPFTIVFAPSEQLGGHVRHFSVVVPPGQNEHVGAFIYLSPLLERKPQAEVDRTVAHEFAHAILGHMRPGRPGLDPDNLPRCHADAPSEIEADSLIANWGFPPAYRRK